MQRYIEVAKLLQLSTQGLAYRRSRRLGCSKRYSHLSCQASGLKSSAAGHLAAIDDSMAATAPGRQQWSDGLVDLWAQQPERERDFDHHHPIHDDLPVPIIFVHLESVLHAWPDKNNIAEKLCEDNYVLLQDPPVRRVQPMLLLVVRAAVGPIKPREYYTGHLQPEPLYFLLIRLPTEEVPRSQNGLRIQKWRRSSWLHRKGEYSL